MKKFILCLMTVVATLTLTTSCGKKTVADTLRDTPKEVTKSKSQKLAEEKPGLRAWGTATNFKQSFARNYADAQARAQFRRNLSTIISDAWRETNDGAIVFHSNGQETAIGTDQGALNDGFTTSIADGLVNGMVVINTDTFQQKDGQYICYVCIEYNGDISKMAAAMTKEAEHRIGQQVSDEDRAKMEVRHDEFQKKVEEKLKQIIQ